MINFFRSLLEKIIFWKCRTWMNENLNAPLESISFHCGLGNLVIANCLQIQGLEFYTTCVCVSTDYRTVLELKHQSSIFISTTKFIKENKIEGTLILKLAMVTVLWKNVHTLYNAILRTARNLLETRENVKISTHPFYHINLSWFSWEWSKKK